MRGARETSEWAEAGMRETENRTLDQGSGDAEGRDHDAESWGESWRLLVTTQS